MLRRCRHRVLELGNRLLERKVVLIAGRLRRGERRGGVLLQKTDPELLVILGGYQAGGFHRMLVHG